MEIVFIRDANDSQTLLSKDGKYPMISTFEIFERIRTQDLADVYPSAGKIFYDLEGWSYGDSEAIVHWSVHPTDSLYRLTLSLVKIKRSSTSRHKSDYRILGF